MRRRALIVATLVLLGLLLAGCGTGGRSSGGDPGHGKELFSKAAGDKPSCSSCHILADAGSQGRVGPNLDDAFAGDRQQGFDDSTIENVVLDQIRFASPPMPANLFRGKDAEDIAAYVAQVAGKPGAGGGTRPPPPAGGGGGTSTGGGGAGSGKGMALYSSLGCNGCHSLNGSPGAGPTFKGLADSNVQLADGTTVTADDPYLLEAIDDPDKQIVKGYQPGIMSAAIKPQSVAQADAKALVEFIRAQK